MPGLETPGSAQRIEVRKGQNLVREFDRLKSRPGRIKIGRSCNPFVRHELRIETIAGTQRASQHWERSHKRLSVFNNDQFVFLTMKIKVRLARWLSLRIQEQTRKADSHRSPRTGRCSGIPCDPSDAREDHILCGLAKIDSQCASHAASRMDRFKR